MTSLMRQLDVLMQYTDEPGHLTRLFLSPAHAAATRRVQDWMREAGMQAEMDAIGNVVGRLPADNDPDAPVVLLGSHIDTVRDAGRYDGNLGVVAAIAAVAELHAHGDALPFAIEVLAFGDEEGVRFPVTLTGSRAVAGTFDPSALDASDDDGISLRDALRVFGGDPDAVAGVARERRRVLAYLELHIEQGPVLEVERLPVGIVTAISGATRMLVSVSGEAGHAGTVPMQLRRDALAAAAEMIVAIRNVGRSTPDLVTTVGRIVARPGAANVIPSEVEFTIDVRSPYDPVRVTALAEIRRWMTAIAETHHVTLTTGRSHEAAAVACAKWIQDLFEAAIVAEGIRPLHLPSCAGHDAMAVAALCPVGMLFVRCRGGISHNPGESIKGADAETAVRVLLRVLRGFHRPE
jgi:allantoate deiminase